MLIEELSECSEELQGTQDLYTVQRKKEEILPLMMEKGINEPQKLDLKPVPVELKYAYLEEHEQCPVVISSLLALHRKTARWTSSGRTSRLLGGKSLT